MLISQCLPATAQVTFWKTAQNNNKEYPEAAEEVTKNSYMDDICDPTDTVMLAQKVTEVLDKLLESVGLYS